MDSVHVGNENELVKCTTRLVKGIPNVVDDLAIAVVGRQASGHRKLVSAQPVQ